MNFIGPISYYNHNEALKLVIRALECPPHTAQVQTRRIGRLFSVGMPVAHEMQAFSVTTGYLSPLEERVWLKAAAAATV